MVSIGMYITELLRSGGLRMMNRKFIFVGLVLVVFVFSHMFLNIGKGGGTSWSKVYQFQKAAKKIAMFPTEGA